MGLWLGDKPVILERVGPLWGHPLPPVDAGATRGGVGRSGVDG